MRLRDFTIKSKLYGITVFSVLVLALMLGLSLWCLDTFRVNGPVYQDIVRNKDVLADVLPPPMYIIEAFLTAHQAEGVSDPAQLAALRDRVRELENEYHARFDKWTVDLPDDEMKTLLLRRSAAPAMEFFRACREDYFPALARGDRATASELLHGKLADAYARHRAEVDRTVALAEARTRATEERTAGRSNFWVRAMMVISLGSLVVMLVVSWPLIRDVMRSTMVLIRRVEQMAGGDADLTTRVQIDSKDEMGRLATGINATIGKMEEAVRRARHAEEELRRVSDRLSVATMSAGVGIWDWDVSGDKLVWDDTMLRLYGIAREDFGGTYDAWMRSVHPEDRERGDARVQASLGKEGEDFVAEFRVVWPDGSVHVVQAIARIFRDGHGRARRMLGVNYDITARKHAEAELCDAKEAAEAASRAKDHFIAVVSHELRTPLTPVLGKILLLERDPALPPDLRPGLEMMRRNIELEVRLIEDLLDVHGIMRGELRLEPGTVDAHDALRATVETCASEIADKRHQVELDLRAERHTLRADPARLQQVLWNLLGNAAKYTPPGGRIVLRTSNTPAGDLRIEVVDNGIGIAPEAIDQIFLPFVQGEQTLSRHYGGLGLGLAISKALVEAQQGTITVRSEGKGQGSTFALEFPTLATAPAAAAPRPAPSADGRPLRILLVEDDADTLRIMTRLLRLSKHEVRSAMTLREALDVARAWEFDLLVSDIGLPDGTGWDLMTQLRRERPTKGIAVSGFVTSDDVLRSKDAGFEDHLAKPLKLESLESAIQSATRAA